MPYLVSMILVVSSALVIMLTRYEPDNSAIKEEIKSMEVMFSMVDGFVNTYIESGESIDSVNFEVLETNGILLSNATVTGTEKASVLTLPNNTVTWQLIPNKDDSSSYKLLVDMTGNSVLMSKPKFSESFIGREYCENDLFGTLELTKNFYKFDVVDEEDFIDSGTATVSDGIFVCIVFK